MCAKQTIQTCEMKRGKIDVFHVSLDSETATYFPGQKVSGILHVNVLKAIKIRGIHVRFLGSSFVSNSKNHHHHKYSHYKGHYNYLKYNNSYSISSTNDNGSDIRKFYKDTEVYFDFKQVVYGSDDQEILPKGNYEFPFSMDLPSNLPTSFEGTRGYVRYTIMCKATRKQNSPLANNVATFTVLSIVDLNNIPNIDVFVKREETRYFGFLFFKTGAINVTATINKTGFVSGENIIINASIVNGSKKKISKTTAVLVSNITYQTDGSKREETRELNKAMQHSILPNDSDEWNNVPIKIPSVPPTGLGGCCLISVEYFLTFTCECELGNIELTFPIFIGTVPLITTMITSNIVPQRPAPSPPYNQHQFNIPVVATNIASGECPGCNEHFAVSEKIYTEEEAAATGGNQATNVMQDAAPPPYEDCIRGPYNMQFQEDARTEDDITSQMSKFYVAYSYDHSEA